MPDEPEAPTLAPGADAPPSAPEAPAVPDKEQDELPAEQAGEGAPVLEVEDEAQGEEVAEEPQVLDERRDTIRRIAAQIKEDPEALADFTEELGIAPEPVSEREQQLLHKQADFDREATLKVVANEAYPYIHPDSVRQSTDTFANQIVNGVAALTAKIAETGEAGEKLDLRAVSNQYATFVNKATAATGNWKEAEARAIAQEAVTKHPVAQYFSDEDMIEIEASYRGANQRERLGNYFWTALNVAQRSGPEFQEQQQGRETERGLELKKGLDETLTKLGGNGKKSSLAAAAGAPPEKRSDRELLMDPSTPITKLSEIRKRQQKAKE